MINENELIDFVNWLKQATNDITIPYKTETIVSSYLKSIKSSADKLEICRCINKNCMHHKGGFCMAKAWDCKDRQIDNKVIAIDV